MDEVVHTVVGEVVRLDCVIMNCDGSEGLDIFVESREDGAWMLWSVPEFVEGRDGGRKLDGLGGVREEDAI